MSLYLPDLDALFLHVPKTGGTWVAKVLSASGIVCVPARGVGTHNHPSAYADRGQRFMFVRDPLTWYESAWKALHGSWPDRRELSPLHRERTWSPIRNLTYLAGDRGFHDFCENIIRVQPAFCSRMFEWYAGPPGYPQVDFVGRMESLRSDLQTILSWLGWSGGLADVPAENVGDPLDPVWNAAQRQRVLDQEFTRERWYSTDGPFRVEAQ